MHYNFKSITSGEVQDIFVKVMHISAGLIVFIFDLLFVLLRKNVHLLFPPAPLFCVIVNDISLGWFDKRHLKTSPFVS